MTAKCKNDTELNCQERSRHKLQTLSKIWVNTWENTKLSPSTSRLLPCEAPVNQQSQQRTKSDHQRDQHMIYKISQEISVSSMSQAGASSNVAHFCKSFLFRCMSLSLKSPQSKGSARGKSRPQNHCSRSLKQTSSHLHMQCSLDIYRHHTTHMRMHMSDFDWCRKGVIVSGIHSQSFPMFKKCYTILFWSQNYCKQNKEIID